MDCEKIGALIASLRRERGWTQAQLAQRLHVSAKTVSKWECGGGCPDVSLLPELTACLGVDAAVILSGELQRSNREGGTMKRIQFFVCPACGNILTACGAAELSCCGRKLQPLTPAPCDEAHRVHSELVEDEQYLTLDHAMTKEHAIAFVAYVTYDRLLLVRLYPEQSAQLRIPCYGRGRLFVYCTQHGLMEQ